MNNDPYRNYTQLLTTISNTLLESRFGKDWRSSTIAPRHIDRAVVEADAILVALGQAPVYADDETACEICGNTAPADQYHPTLHDEGSPLIACNTCMADRAVAP